MKTTYKDLSKLCLAVFALVFMTVNVFAQESKVIPPPFKSYVYLQPNLGLTQYYGDLNPNDFYNKDMKFGAGGVIGYQWKPYLGARGQFTAGKLYSTSDVWSKDLNSKIWDVSGQLVVNVNELFKRNPDRFLNLYVLGGIGYINEDNTVKNYDGTVFGAAKNDGLSFPVGGGLSFRLAKSIDLNLEYVHHVTGRDIEMDFISNHGQSNKYDQYSYASAGLTFKFLPKDKDNDGVKDKEDLCPETAGKIDLAGCPDKDNDGIADKDDACPDVAGKAEFKGCPDTDGDGIPDKDDRSPNIAGRKELMGSPDKDNDGIADEDDKCPDVAGKKELGGCPDRDGDGIIDSEDACPDLAGLVKFSGCPDKDGDNVPDNKDKCPEIAGTVANMGCPEETKALIDKVVYFNTDEDIVIAKYNQLLYQVIEMMKDNPGIKIKVDGHADERGTEEYNMDLSERRANYVIKFLAKKGIDKSRMVKGFYGKTRPVADNRTEEGMKLNRRVEIQSIK